MHLNGPDPFFEIKILLNSEAKTKGSYFYNHLALKLNHLNNLNRLIH